MRTHYPAGVADAPFLTNHDHVRVATQLEGNPGRLANAAALLLTLPGSPFVYYGEELGMANGTTRNDEAKRTPMPWNAETGGGFTTGAPWFSFAPGREQANVAAQVGAPGSLLARYRGLIHARHASEALDGGGLTLLTSTQGHSPTLAFLRTRGEERVLVVHNLTETTVTAGPFELPEESAQVLFTDPSVGSLLRGNGSWSVTLPRRATGIWRLR
jgi:glycosidase